MHSERAMSCYGTALLTEFALKKGISQKSLFLDIEQFQPQLSNGQEWIAMPPLIRFLENCERAGIDLFQAGLELTRNQVSQFQLMLLKIAPISFLARHYPKQFEKTISTFIKLKTELHEDAGVLDIYLTPKDKTLFSRRICEWNRGLALATGQIKRLRDLRIEEISCAARPDSPHCHYRLSWTPDPLLLSRLKQFLLLRFTNQHAIFSHMEESHNRLQAQYDKASKLNERLIATLAEKEKLSDTLQTLNVNLERTVAEQTADIRMKNESLQKANEQLRESEHMKELLTGALVHDIKNHIFSISTDVRVLEKEEEVTDDAKFILKHASSACSSAISLASNMLDIGKMEEGKLEIKPVPMDFNAITRQLSHYTANVLFRDRNVAVQVVKPNFPISILADEYLLERVFQNLLANASMYTPANGRVEITFADPLTVKVFNSGAPISEEFRDSLFEKYSRVDIRSSKYAKGLGLFFCKLVMTAHNGSISLECTPDGNCFVLRFAKNRNPDAIG